MDVRVEKSVEVTTVIHHRLKARNAMDSASAERAFTKEGCHDDLVGLEG